MRFKNYKKKSTNFDHRMLIGGNFLVTIGALGFSFADAYWSMILTRIVFGFGLELVIVAVSLLIVQ